MENTDQGQALPAGMEGWGPLRVSAHLQSVSESRGPKTAAYLLFLSSPAGVFSHCISGQEKGT